MEPGAKSSQSWGPVLSRKGQGWYPYGACLLAGGSWKGKAMVRAAVDPAGCPQPTQEGSPEGVLSLRPPTHSGARAAAGTN